MKITACLLVAACGLVLLAWRSLQRVNAERSEDTAAPEGERERIARGGSRGVSHHLDHPCGECMLASFLESR